MHTTVEQWKRKSFVMRHAISRGEAVLCEVREVCIFAIRHPEDPSRIKAAHPPEELRRLCE